MHISYQPLWDTLKERGMRKEDLRLSAGLTTNMIANMGKGKHICMGTLLRICKALNCGILNVNEFVLDDERGGRGGGGGAAGGTIEKELSDFGLICGLQRKI